MTSLDPDTIKVTESPSESSAEELDTNFVDVDPMLVEELIRQACESRP